MFPAPGVKNEDSTIKLLKNVSISTEKFERVPCYELLLKLYNFSNSCFGSCTNYLPHRIHTSKKGILKNVMINDYVLETS